MNLKFLTKLTLILLFVELIADLNLGSVNQFWDSQLEVEEEGEPSFASFANQEKTSNMDKTVIIQGLDSIQMSSKCKNDAISNDLTKIIVKPENRRIRKIKLLYTDKDNHSRTLEILPHFDTNKFTPDLIQINIMRKNQSALQKAAQNGTKEKRFGTLETESEFIPVNIITGGNESCAKYIIIVNGNVNASNITPVYDNKQKSLPKSKYIELNKIKNREKKLHEKVSLMSSTLTWSSTSTKSPFTSSLSSILLKKEVTSNRDQALVPTVKPTMLTKLMGKVPEKKSGCKSNILQVKKAKVRKELHCPPHIHHHTRPHRYHVRQKYTHISFTTNGPEKTLSTVSSETKWAEKRNKSRVTKHKYKVTHPGKSKAKIPIDRYLRRPDQTFYGKPKTEHQTTLKVSHQAKASLKPEHIDNLNTNIDKMLRDIKKSEYEMKTTEASIQEMTESGQTTTTPLDEDVMEIHSDHSPFFFFLLNLQGYKVENGHLVDKGEKGTAFQALNRIFKHKGHHKKHPKHHK